MKHFLLLFLLLYVGVFAQAQSRLSYENYDLILSENFDYQSITELSKKWATQVSPKLNMGTAKYSTQQISFLPRGIRLTATPGQGMDDTLRCGTPSPNKTTAAYQSGLLRRHLTQDYGIFEILVKMPNGNENINDAWPVFKLVNETTEINIFDGHADVNGQLAQNITATLQPNTKLQCGNNWDLEAFHEGWDSDFYVFQMAWTPENISFFIHGREVAKVNTSEFSQPIADMDLVIALQTDQASNESFFMDIQEVNIYTHKPNRPYKYLEDYTWVFHEVSGIEIQEGLDVIFPNLDNTNEVSFIGKNGKSYQAVLENGEWKTTQKTIKIAEYVALYKTLLKQMMSLSIKDNLADRPGSITKAEGLNKDFVAFTGKDNKLHFLTKDKKIYTPSEYTYGIQDLAHPDYIASKIVAAGNDIFYLAEDGRLLVFSWDYPNNKRARWWVDGNFFTESRLGDPTGDLARGANDQIYFRTKKGTLAYFQWEKVGQDCDCTIIPVEPKQRPGISNINLQLFPNPTADILNINFTKACADCVAQYEVLSIDGKKIMQGQFTGNVHAIDVENLPAGTYQLNVLSEKEKLSKAFTKQ